MENFNEVQNDFENFNNLDYLQKLALIDKYQIECLMTNKKCREKRLDNIHYVISSNQHSNILTSENSNDFNLYSFLPKNENEYSQFLSWLVKREDFYYKSFETIKNEFLEKYTKANNKELVFNDFYREYDKKINGGGDFSINKLYHSYYRFFYDIGVKDFNYANTALEGLKELLLDTQYIWSSLDFSRIVKYCYFYFQGIADANLLYFLQNEKESLEKFIAPATSQKGEYLGTIIKGFNLGLTEEQLKDLHQLLVNEHFIVCTEIDFINAFSGQQIVNKLEWIDKGERLTTHVTIQTVFQLLYSCNIELSDKNRVVLKEVKSALGYIFSNKWGNINSKFNDFKPLTTDRQKAIDSTINSLKS